MAAIPIAQRVFEQWNLDVSALRCVPSGSKSRHFKRQASQELWSLEGSESPLAGSLLRKVPPNSLVLWDRGFYGYRSLAEARRRNVHVLGRVGHGVIFQVVRTLGDGSFPSRLRAGLAAIYPTGSDRRHQTKGLLPFAAQGRVRVIEYTFDDPNRPGYGQRHRVVTTVSSQLRTCYPQKRPEHCRPPQPQTAFEQAVVILK
ncbi:MAG: hypothetical protein V1790_15550 [Planctomycetota bacterium]